VAIDPAASQLPLARLALLVTAFSCACHGERHFHSVAVYEAPRSGCSIRMEADGVVSPGADLSDRSAAVVTFGTTTSAVQAARAPVVVQVSLWQGQVQFGSDVYAQGASPTRGREVLSSRMSDAGCSPAPEESLELWAAIEGVLFGPKGTLMPGQTTLLKVRSTSFDR
jgi:hypothetical protein